MSGPSYAGVIGDPVPEAVPSRRFLSAASSRGAWAPWAVVGAAVAWNLVALRAETQPVSYLNDSSLHEQMVRFATQQFQNGHLPLDRWFPDLGLGSPQFLHYQALPAMLTGLAGTVVGADVAFRWSLYLLLCLWPVSIYLGARLLGLCRSAAAASAAMAPFVMSAVGIGYEEKAYLWIGYGIWTQMWASLTLPLAWGLSWRAIRDGRNFFPAVVAVALTIAFHFETGYLALLPLLLWPFAVRRPPITRLIRSAVLGLGALLASAWVIVPLLGQRRWAATNEVLHGSLLANGYGAERVLGWLATGRLLDSGRAPVITFFAAAGLAIACIRWRQDHALRAIVLALAGCLMLSFGRTTFGVFVDVLPGNADIFFRRFVMGVQLAAVLLAGPGASWCGHKLLYVLDAAGRQWHSATAGAIRYGRVSRILVCVAGIALLSPAWLQLLSYDQRNSAAIHAQMSAERSQGRELDRLLAVVTRNGNGRVYAGTPSNWGPTFRVGAVPVFKYLESRDIDEVGYTLRTASLMTDPEYHFDERNPSDYVLFGVRYVILPYRQRPFIRATWLSCHGPYCLWRVREARYLEVGSVVGQLSADRTNVGVRSLQLLHSRLPEAGAYLRVAFASQPGGAVALPMVRGSAGVGRVVAERSYLGGGDATATVRLRRPGIAILSASFDPGWKVRLDGQPRPVFMVAPALAATQVPAGTHTLTFRYSAFPGYLALFVLSGAALLALGVGEHWLLRLGRLHSKRRSRGIVARVARGVRGKEAE
jgi:hypothetical protein